MSWNKKCFNCDKDGKLRDIDKKGMLRYTCLDCEVIIRNKEEDLIE